MAEARAPPARARNASFPAVEAKVQRHDPRRSARLRGLTHEFYCYVFGGAGVIGGFTVMVLIGR